jgi:hypothetical protein
MESSIFFDEANTISDFHSVSDRSQYIPVPDDWWVVTADVKNSTHAIENGRYKAVNMTGASVIAAINNLYENRYELPFTFGGDGATIIVPDQKIDAVHGILNGCIKVARDEFGLDLKAGLVQMQNLSKKGLDILVAKLRLSDTASIALFWGDGLPYAEEFIKKEDTLQKNILTPDFSGLECRWNEIPPEYDETIAVIIKVNSGSPQKASDIYQRCILNAEEIFGSLDSCNPISVKKLSFAKSPSKLGVEWKIRTANSKRMNRLVYFFKLLYQQGVGYYLMTKRIVTKNTDWGRYKTDLVKQTDYQKFGDGLRFVISGTEAQRIELEQFLEQEYKKENLHFGVHGSRGLLITCLIKNHHREHVHFVDGMDGGYAMAAKKMKKRMMNLK